MPLPTSLSSISRHPTKSLLSINVFVVVTALERVLNGIVLMTLSRLSQVGRIQIELQHRTKKVIFRNHPAVFLLISQFSSIDLSTQWQLPDRPLEGVKREREREESWEIEKGKAVSETRLAFFWTPGFPNYLFPLYFPRRSSPEISNCLCSSNSAAGNCFGLLALIGGLFLVRMLRENSEGKNSIGNGSEIHWGRRLFYFQDSIFCFGHDFTW